MSNQRNVLIVGVMNITGWTAKKKAKSVEKDAEHAAGAVDGSISARKALLPGAATLEAITNYQANARNWWNTQSKEWMGSMRVYHASKHIDIMVEIGDRQRAYYELVDTFMADYPVLRAEAQFKLNNLFDPGEYPDPSVVRAKFRFDFESMALPTGDDIRLIDSDLVPQDEVDRMVFEAEARAQSRMQEAMKSAYGDLYAVVTKYVERLNARNDSEDADAKKLASIHDTVVDNILSIVDSMPGLNLTEDQKLTKLTQEAKDLAEMFTVKELKESRASRVLATQKAQSIAQQFAGMFD